MASLTGQLVAETYKALLKTIDNDILTASEKQITDGFGGGSNVFIDSQGFLRANKYKVTNGLATQFLKADGSLDANTYLTGITSSQIITALGYTPVTNARTLTINGTTYDLSANRSWTIAGTAAVWGNISGTLSDQTDLQNALNAKYNNPTGTISQYIRGDGTLATFPTLPGGLPTGGTAGQILAKIDATDYNAHWIDNYATQTKNEVKLGAALSKGTPVYVSSANGTNMIVSAASNTSEATSSKTFGLLETGGALNDQVKCVTFGLLAGLDTSTAQAGDAVWLGPNGTLLYGLANKPVAPAHMVYIGVVTRVQQNNGEIFVNVQNGFEIEELHDVLIQSKANNQGLFYESSTGLWKNKSIATVLGYTPQAQLSGTGFVKASGTTITYDNSTYLTTADAASTYLALIGGTLTGNLTISNANPKLFLTDTDNNPDYSIQNSNGTFKITDETNSADRFFIYSTGIGYYNGDFKANKLYVEGGTSSQFIKGDGTLDTNTYLTSASLDGYLAKAGGTMSGDLNFYTLKTTRVGGNAYIRGSWQGTYWGIGAAATGHTIIIDQVDFSTGAYESITDVNLMLGTRTVLHSGNYSSYALPITGGTVTGSITATSFVKSGGTASQFLMADGSVSTLSSPVTGSGSAGYIPKWTSASNVGSSNISDDGTSIGIAYTTPNKGGYGRAITGAAFGSASFGFEAVGLTTTNGGLLGGFSIILANNDASRIVGASIQSNLVGTTATNYGADLRFYAKADAGVIGEVARMTSAGLRVYGTIVKDGGTSSQYLMANGSVSTGPDLSGYLPLTGGTLSGNLTINSSTDWNAVSTNNGSGLTSPRGAFFVSAYPSTSDRYYTQFSGNWQSAGTWGLGVRGSADNSIYLARNNSGILDITASVNLYIGSGLALHTSNYSSYALPLSGGTMTGVISGNGSGNFYMYFYSRIGLPNTGRILYNNGTGSNMFFGEIAADVYGFTGNLYSDTPTIAFNLSSQRVGIGLSNPQTKTQIYSSTSISTSGNEYGYALWVSQTNINKTLILGFSDVFDAGIIASVFVGNAWKNTIINADGGAVLVGKTSSDGYGKLQVSGNVTATGAFKAGRFGYLFPSYSGNRTWELASDPNVGDGAYMYANSAGYVQSWFAGGNIGINTTTDAGYKFDVNGTSRFQSNVLLSTGGNGYFFFDRPNNGFDAVTIYRTNAANKWILGTRGNSNDNFHLYSYGTGNQPLEIVYSSGESIFSGQITANGGINFASTVRMRWGGNNTPALGFPFGGSDTGNSLFIEAADGDTGGIAINNDGVTVYGAADTGFVFRAIDEDSYQSGVGLAAATTFQVNQGTNGGGYIRGNFNIYNGSAYADAFYENSDFRLKKLIDGSAQVSGIENLEAKLYIKNGKTELGYFAQDAEKLMPYAVEKNSDGFLSLSYREVHTAKIARLEQRVAELEKQLNLN